MADKAPSIYKKLAKVMSETHRIPKNGYNSFHRYHYATEADVSDHIRNILYENGIALTFSCGEQMRDGEFTKVQVVVRFTCVDTGETVESVVWGEGQDKGDKGLYKAYTGAMKYALMKTFLIPTGDDPEADISVDERNAKAPAKPKAEPRQGRQEPAGVPEGVTPATIDEVMAVAAPLGLQKGQVMNYTITTFGLKTWSQATPEILGAVRDAILAGELRAAS